jgi:hypothetical protein
MTALLTRRSLLALLAAGLFAAPAPAADKAAATLTLNLRTRVETFKGSGSWDEVALKKEFPAKETAIIICDVWDKHWCESATKRCDALAKKMAPVIDAARAKGVLIIHAPSECMDFYKDTPQRRMMEKLTKVAPPKPLDLTEPPLPIDDSDGAATTCRRRSPPRRGRASIRPSRSPTATRFRTRATRCTAC